MELMSACLRHVQVPWTEDMIMTQAVEVGTRTHADVRDLTPAYQAFQMLHMLFAFIPIAAGADKFFNFLVNWDKYLAPVIPQITGLSAQTFMMGVGVIEIVAGLIVLLKPRIGSLIVAVWLAGIIVNLLATAGFLDIAVRDFGLMVAAIALFRLSAIFGK